MSNSITMNGINFTKDSKTGYYLSSKAIDGKRIRFHRYVYTLRFGTIPKGMAIHHKDMNKDNNEIDNLILMNKKDHSKYHGDNLSCELKGKYIKNLNENARPKAIEWHKSDDAKEWHRKHWNESIGKHLDKTQDCVCIVCGEQYLVSKMFEFKTMFCSNKCKSKYRRNNKLDNINKECIICSKVFSSNKYENILTCSRICGGIYATNNRYSKTCKN